MKSRYPHAQLLPYLLSHGLQQGGVVPVLTSPSLGVAGIRIRALLFPRLPVFLPVFPPSLFPHLPPVILRGVCHQITLCFRARFGGLVDGVFQCGGQHWHGIRLRVGFEALLVVVTV